jgi:hypothetical protein
MRRTAGSIFHRSLLLFLPADVFSTSELHHFPATGVVAGCWFANDLLDRHCSVRGCGLPCGRGNTLLVRRTRAVSSALCTYRSVPVAEHSGDEHSAARRRPAARPWRRAAAGRAYITDPVTWARVDGTHARIGPVVHPCNAGMHTATDVVYVKVICRVIETLNDDERGCRCPRTRGVYSGRRPTRDGDRGCRPPNRQKQNCIDEMTTRERAPSPPSKEAGSIMQDSGKGKRFFIYLFIYTNLQKKYISSKVLQNYVV